MMLHFSIFLTFAMSLISQEITLTTDVNIKQGFEEDESATFSRGKFNCEQKLNFMLETHLKDELGIEIARSDLLRILELSDVVRFQAMRSKWVGGRLFMIADYKFDQREFIKELDAYYSTADSESSFEKKSLKYSVDKIRVFKNRFEQRRLENTKVLLNLINVGMHRRDLFDVFLYLAERKISFDTDNIDTTAEGSRYPIKNTYINLLFSKESYLKEIVDFTPDYLSK